MTKLEAAPPPDTTPLGRMSAITKRFDRVIALGDVQLELRSGEVHVLAGENGAGNTTLLGILAGTCSDFEGRLEFAGIEVCPRTPIEAQALGAALLHPEPLLLGSMSVADNLFLGRFPARAGFVRERQQRQQYSLCPAQAGGDRGYCGPDHGAARGALDRHGGRR